MKEGRLSLMIINSTPSGAKVTVDGKAMTPMPGAAAANDKTPLLVNLFKKDAPRRVQISLPGYKPVERVVDVNGSPVAIEVTLEPLDGKSTTAQPAPTVIPAAIPASKSESQLRHIKGFILGESFDYNVNGKAFTNLPPANGRQTYEVCTEYLAQKHKKDDRIAGGCRAYVSAHDGEKSVLFSDDLSLTFDKGKLTEVEMGLNGIVSGKTYDYDTLYNSALEKYGKATQESARTLQNGFGATWQARSAIWIGEGVILSIIEGDDRVNPFAALSVRLMPEGDVKTEPKKNILD
jgi:hypothetical protein